jgi:hypothetical protein
MLQEPAIGYLIDLHLPIEGQQYGHIQMITDVLGLGLHTDLLK